MPSKKFLNDTQKLNEHADLLIQIMKELKGEIKKKMTIVEGFKKYSELMIELEYSVLKYIEHIKELENQTFKE